MAFKTSRLSPDFIPLAAANGQKDPIALDIKSKAALGDKKVNEPVKNNDQHAANANDPCELTFTHVEPSLANIDNLPIRNAAYVRFQEQFTENGDILRHVYNNTLKGGTNKIYYVNKATRECREVIAADNQALMLFDDAFNLTDPNRKSGLNAFNTTRFLSEKELNKILLLTGHNHLAQRASFPEASAWQTKNGCDLIISNVRPTKENLNSFPISNAAYIRYKNRLYYVNKKAWDLPLFKMSKIRRFKMSDERLARFDQALKTDQSQHRKLTDKELAKIKEVINHNHTTTLQRILSVFGLVCSAIIAVGSGISTAGTFISMNIATGGVAGLVAAVLFITGTAVNWWIFKRYVSPVLVDLFGREKFMVDEDGKPLSKLKKVFMGIAVALAASVGITFAALTFSSTFDLVFAFPFLAAIGPALPYVAGILAGVTLVCMTAMMLKDIADLIKKKDIKKEIKGFLKNLVSIDPELPENRGKSPRRIFWERNFRVALTFLFLPLACIGLFMTMNACAPGVKAILIDKIPFLSIKAAEVIANVISLGFAFVGQIPFGIQTAFQTLFRISNAIFKVRNNKPGVEAGPNPPFNFKKACKNAWERFKMFCAGANAVGNGGISAKGAGGNNLFLTILALLSGTANSAFAGIPAVLAKFRLSKLLSLRPKDDLYLNKLPAAKQSAFGNDAHLKLYAKPAQLDLVAPHSDRPLKPLQFSDKLNHDLKNSLGLFATEAKNEEQKEVKGRPRNPRFFSSDDMAPIMAKSAKPAAVRQARRASISSV